MTSKHRALPFRRCPRTPTQFFGPVSLGMQRRLVLWPPWAAGKAGNVIFDFGTKT